MSARLVDTRLHRDDPDESRCTCDGEDVDELCPVHSDGEALAARAAHLADLAHDVYSERA